MNRPEPSCIRYCVDDAIHAAIWTRESNPSLFRMLRTWLSTVRSEINRRVTIFLFLRPAATHRAISASRLASNPAPASSEVAAATLTGSPMERVETRFGQFQAGDQVCKTFSRPDK